MRSRWRAPVRSGASSSGNLKIEIARFCALKSRNPAISKLPVSQKTILLNGLEIVHGRLRIEETRAYEVGPDSLRGQLCGNTRGQPDQSVFRSGLRGSGGKAEKRIYESNVTIAPPRPPASLSLADSCCMRYAEKGAFEVDVARSHSSSGRSVIPENCPSMPALFRSVRAAPVN